MALKAFYAKREDIPEALREYYKEENGKFVLEAEGVEDVTGLKSALEEERTRRKELERKSKGSSSGNDDRLTPKEREELKELREARERAEEDELKRKGDYEKLEQRLHSDYAKKLEDKDGTLNKFKGSLHNVLLENAATKAISHHKGDANLLLPHVQKHLRVVESGDGKFSVEVADGDSARYSTKDPKQAMSVEELLEVDFLTHDSYSRAFEGRNHSGGGNPPNSGTRSGGAVTITKSQARDNRAYRAAQEQAVKIGQDRPIIVDDN